MHSWVLKCFVSLLTRDLLRGAGDDKKPFHCTLSQQQGHKMHNNLQRWQLFSVMARPVMQTLVRWAFLVALHLSVALERLPVWLGGDINFHFGIWLLLWSLIYLGWRWEQVGNPLTEQLALLRFCIWKKQKWKLWGVFEKNMKINYLMCYCTFCVI